jgi:hypothetical protein
MARVWKKAVTEAGLVPGEGTDRDGKAPKPYVKKVKELPEVLSPAQMKSLAKPTSVDASEANAASIAFILEHQKKRVLFAADANPKELVPALERFGRMKGESRVRLDICKLPHHGSRANVTTELIEAIQTSRYLISTDGMTFGHPDDAAIARILQSSAEPARIYCNYASDRTKGWVKRAAAAGGKVILPGGGSKPVRIEVQS